ncbi:hypothetical protein BDW59DRAFT_16821 [Aspergillus cavernicola]|uniref:Fe2OG dioxygenase domain-containing protein n=1 Tax=Aspergillus cavernicola TaxID=176166 RepID=A0ABR4HIB7_9EURO
MEPEIPESGDDDYDHDQSDPTPPPPQYCHTVAELEDEVNRVMIRNCKVDACVDLFLSRVWSCGDPEDKKTYYYANWNSDRTLQSVPEENLEYMTEELQRNLRRLVPGYLRDQNIDILKEEKVRKKLKQRWSGIAQGTHPKDRDIVPQSLVHTLADKQYRERAGPQLTSSDARDTSIETCRQLRRFIEGERAVASFACGGTIPITINTGLETGLKIPDSTSSPVSIFWRKGDESTAHKLVLPIDTYAPKSSTGTLQHLVTDCDPASFGRGDQDVIDPEYRKAGKIDANHFATSFHPADFGILENIGQVLLPSISSETDNQLQFRKIKAELYKLNVYSGPSGLFRKHVDTPRAPSQIGSLVVCLPSEFTGGRLTVEHQGQKVEFDWGENSSTMIQWAAFYSDCEHEIETITQGDRITLTYNLYVTEPVGGVIPSPTSIVDPKTLPMYGWVKDLLGQDDFMKEGGVLGIFCSHAYAHSSKIAEFQLPRALKGADLVLYAVFKSLGIDIEVLPVLEHAGRYITENPDLGLEGKSPRRRGYMSQYNYYEGGPLTNYLKKGYKPLVPDVSELLPSPSSTDQYEDIDRRWKTLMMTRQVRGMTETLRDAQHRNLPTNKDSFYYDIGAQIGTSRRAYEATDYGCEADLDDVVREVWPAYYLPGITWVTEPKHEQMAFSQIAYGNEASIGTRYSCAAILAVIPPSDQRRLSLEQVSS